MANWSKRTTFKAGNQGQRVTRTNSSKGTSTFSTSKRVGNTRTTQTTKSNSGKIKIYTTEHHPVLGTKRTVRTVNPTVKVKKPKKPRKTRPKKYKPSTTRKTSRVSYNYVRAEPSAFGQWLSSIKTRWWIIGVILLVLGAAWYIWLIYFSAFLKFNVDYFK